MDTFSSSNFKSEEELLQLFDGILEAIPNDIKTLKNKAYLLERLRRYSEAIDCYGTIINLEPKNIDAYERKGLLLKALNKSQEALRCFNDALLIEPTNLNLISGKGQTLYKLKNFQEARNYFDKVLEIEPSHLTTLVHKGHMLTELEDFEEALKCFDRSHLIKPDDKFIQENITLIKNKLKRSPAQIQLEALQIQGFKKLGFSPEYAKDLINKKSEILKHDGDFKNKIISKYSHLFDKNVIEEFFDKAKDAEESVKPSTPYEDKFYWQTLVSLVDYIEDALENTHTQEPDYLSLKQHYQSNFKKPVIGTLPSGRINAISMQISQSDEHLIILESGLFMFCDIISDVVSNFIPYMETEDGFVFNINDDMINSKIKNQEKLLGVFKESIVAYLTSNEIAPLTSVLKDKTSHAYSLMLSSSMKYFILGHEYSHILRNHFHKAKVVEYALGSSETKYDWNDEYQADQDGLLIMQNTKSKERIYDLRINYLGPELFFSFIDIIEDGVVLLGNQNGKHNPRGSHPPSNLRKNMLREFIEKKYGTDKIFGAFMVDKIIQSLWNDNVRPIIAENKENYKLSNRWITE